MSSFGGLSQDHFLGGRVRLWQPVDGYRSGVDPVILAAATDAREGQSVLELGCGAGAALCCLGARVSALTLDGLEIQPAYAELARRNLSENGLTGSVFDGDVSNAPKALRQHAYNHVIANPPYFETARGLAARNAGRHTGRCGEVPMEVWVDLAARRLRPGGYATFIQRAERLPDLLAAFGKRLGSLELLPLLPRVGREPRLILIRGRKDGRAPFRFHAAPVMHPGDTHGYDGEGYTPLFESLFRDGAALPFPK